MKFVIKKKNMIYGVLLPLAGVLSYAVYFMLKPRTIEAKIERAVLSFASGHVDEVTNTMPESQKEARKLRHIRSRCVEQSIYAMALEVPFTIKAVKVEHFNFGSAASVEFEIKGKECTLHRIVVGKEGDNGPIIGIESWIMLISGIYMAGHRDISKYEPLPQVGMKMFDQIFATQFEVCGYATYSTLGGGATFRAGADEALRLELEKSSRAKVLPK